MSLPPKSRRVGRPTPVTRERELLRALRPMILQVRATLPQIRTPGDARALGAALRRVWSDERIAVIMAAIGAKAEATAARPWRRIERKVGILDAARGRRKKPYDGRQLVNAWSKKATARIRSVRDEIAEAMRKDVVRALEKGVDPADLAAHWRRKGIPVKFGTLEGRTKVIAQNQLATLHAQVQSEKARAIGAQRFVWRTQGDSRVRDAHAALEGTIHRYDDPPSEGLPGTPVNCRCWAETLVEDDLFAEFAPTVGRGE